MWLTGAVFALMLFAATLGTTTTARSPIPVQAGGPRTSIGWSSRARCAGLVPCRSPPAPRGSGALGRCPRAPARRGCARHGRAHRVDRGNVEGAVSYGRNQPWAGPGPDGMRGTDDDPRPLSLRLIPLTLLFPAVYLGFSAVTSPRSRPR